MKRRFAYLNEPLGDEDWKKLLALVLPGPLRKLLDFLHSKNGQAIPLKEMPDYFRMGHYEQLNGALSMHKLPYRLGNAGAVPLKTVLWDNRQFQLFKIKVRLNDYLAKNHDKIMAHTATLKTDEQRKTFLWFLMGLPGMTRELLEDVGRDMDRQHFIEAVAKAVTTHQPIML